nr:hypothetical protein CFP56_32483 [Quercus suber]
MRANQPSLAHPLARVPVARPALGTVPSARQPAENHHTTPPSTHFDAGDFPMLPHLAAGGRALLARARSARAASTWMHLRRSFSCAQPRCWRRSMIQHLFSTAIGDAELRWEKRTGTCRMRSALGSGQRHDSAFRRSWVRETGKEPHAVIEIELARRCMLQRRSHGGKACSRGLSTYARSLNGHRQSCHGAEQANRAGLDETTDGEA